MNTLQAFAMAEANKNKPMRVFDWHKAASLIKKIKPETASAGLSGDWEYTGGKIFEDGKIVEDEYTYLCSPWATPEIELDGEIFDCWVYQKDCPEKFDAHTKWPESAKKILNEK